jgi:succinate dehydrogenase / fumarate reductase cytochrome b subunit
MPEEAVRDRGVPAGEAIGLRARPLSPHLQIYRPQITSVLSISHRVAGVALSVGTLVLVAWIVVLATGSDVAFLAFGALLASPVGLVLMAGWSLALFFHLANGIRHLFWDAGVGLDMPAATRSGWAVIVASVALTVISWLIALLAMRGRA